MIGKTHDSSDPEMAGFPEIRAAHEPFQDNLKVGEGRAYILTYGVAVITVGLATLLTEVMMTATDSTISALFYAAIAISAWYGGLGPGLLAVGLSALASNYFFLPPLYTLDFNSAALIHSGIFLLVALLISSLTGGRQRAEIFAWRQYEQLRVTLTSIGDAVVTTDANGRVTFINPVAATLTGWNQAEATGQPLEDVFRIVNEETRATVENPVRRVIREGDVVGLANHTLLLARDGRERPVDDSAAPIRDEEDQISGVVLIFRDITERRQVEKALKQQSVTLAEQAELLELTQDGIIVWDMDGKITFWNRGAEAMYGWSKAEALGQNIQALLQTQFPKPLEEIQVKLMETGYWEGELVHTHQDKRQVVVASRWAVQRNERGQPIRIMEIMTDISELRRTEQIQRRLAEAGLLLATSLDYKTTLANLAKLVVPDLADWCQVYVKDEDQTIRSLHVAHQDPAKIGLAYEFQNRYPMDWEAPGGVPHVLRTGQPEFYPSITDEMIEAGIPDEEQRRLFQQFQVKSMIVVPMKVREKILGAMTLVWAESGRHYDMDDLVLAEELASRAGLAVEAARLYQAEQQARIEAQQEITAHRQTAEKLKVSLEEKDVLLREVHHRVKNNLQAVSNLLYLQSNYTQEPQTRRKFEEIQNRVKSIALIHEKLYQTQNFIEISFAEYVEELVAHLIRSYKANPELIKLRVTSDGTMLGVDTAVPLGIIVNELVSNALKHAFPGNRAGEIKVELTKQGDGYLKLTVHDNGAGFQEGQDLSSHTDSLGLQLVQMLVSHMRGQVKLSQAEGTQFTITVASLQELEK